MKRTTTLSPAEFQQVIDSLCADSEAELRRTMTLFRTLRTRRPDELAAAA